MALKVLVIPDKFKGTLTAQQAAEAMARGWRAVRPDDSIELLPMSDGGDGFGDVVSGALGAVEQVVKTVDAANRPAQAVWWWHEASRTAIVESARVIGLASLPPAKFHPFELDTRGLGQVLRAAAEKGASRCLLGVGGSATNDAGFGMARALGWQFFNVHDQAITRWTELHSLSAVRPAEKIALFDEMVVGVDVQNPLLGPQGCTRIYGPQKGLRPEEFEFAERCLAQLANILGRELHLDHASDPGAGAAGGLGFGLRSFAAARLEPGFDVFSRLVNLPERLESSQLLITGEGSIDQQTLMGKGVGQLAGLCRERSIACLGLAGIITEMEQAKTLFSAVHALTPDFVSREVALAEPSESLARLAQTAAQNWRG